MGRRTVTGGYGSGVCVRSAHSRSSETMAPFWRNLFRNGKNEREARAARVDRLGDEDDGDSQTRKNL